MQQLANDLFLLISTADPKSFFPRRHSPLDLLVLKIQEVAESFENPVITNSCWHTICNEWEGTLQRLVWNLHAQERALFVTHELRLGRSVS